MHIKFTPFLTFLLYLVFYMHIINVAFETKYFSYFLFISIIVALFVKFTFFPISKELYQSIFYTVAFFFLGLISLIQAENLAWSINALGSFSFRLLTLFLAAIIVNKMGAKYFIEKIDLVWYPIIIIAIIWLADLFSLYGMRVNYENVGSSLLLCLAPIILYQKKLYKLLISTFIIFLMGSRTATFLMFFFLMYSYFFIYSSIKIQTALFVVISTLIVSGTLYFLSGLDLHSDIINTMNPLIPPDKGDYDWVRIYHNFYGTKILQENWLFGVGIGGFQLSLVESIGEEIIPHNFIFFFTAQMGILSLLLFLLMAFYSIKPLFNTKVSSYSKLNLYQAIGLSNFISFLYFLTRPQYDNFLYFAIIGAALGLVFKDHG